MAVTDEQLTALRAMLVGDADGYVQLAGRLDQEAAATGLTALIGAAFMIAADRRFSDKTAEFEFVRFVADIRARGDRIADMDPTMAEDLLKEAVGAGPTVQVDENVRLQTHFLLLNALVATADYDSDELEAFLSESRSVADQILARWAE